MNASGAAEAERSRASFAARDFAAALASAERAIAAAPERFEGHELRAEALVKTGALKEALGGFDRALELARGAGASDLELARLLNARAELKRRLGEPAGAEADATRCIALEPHSAGGYIVRAEARRARGRFKAALGDLDRAAAAAPRDAWVRVVRAKVLRAAGDAEGAVAACAQALALEPRTAKAYAWRGESLRALGRLDEARADLDRAVALDAACAWALALRGQTRAECGDAAGGARDLEAAFRLDPRCSGGYDFLDGERGLAADPLCAWMRAWRGGARCAAGDAGGLAELERAVAEDPRWSWMHARLGRARLDAGDARGARRALERAVRLAPGDAAARLWRGEALRRSGRARAALPDLNFALMEAPGSPPALVSRALAKLALGDASFAADFRRAFGTDGGWRARADEIAAGLGLSAERLDALLARGGAGEEEDEDALREWAAAEFAAGRGVEARPRLLRALKKSPNSAVIALLAWRARDPRGRGSSTALSELERVVALGAESAPTLAWLGAARLDRGLVRAGLDSLARAAALDPARAWLHATWPTNARGSLERGAAFRRRLAAASARLRRSLRHRPLVAYLEAQSLKTLGRYEAARVRWSAARPFFVGCQWAWHAGLGELALKCGRAAEAREALDRAVALDPSQPRALCWRGELRWWLGDAAGAEADFAAAIAAAPDVHWVRAWRGQFLLWRGRPAEARVELERAISLEPGHGWAYGWRAAVSILERRPLEALADADLALARDPSDREARLWRAEALVALGRSAAARADLDRAIASDPGRVWAYVLRGLLRGRAGDRRGLRDDFNAARRFAPDLIDDSKADRDPDFMLLALQRARARAGGNLNYRRLS